VPAEGGLLSFLRSMMIHRDEKRKRKESKRVVFLSLHRREMGNWRCLDQSCGRSCPRRGFLSLSLSLSGSDFGEMTFTRARSRCVHRRTHRFDSMRAFDFNKSALELSFLVVARGFVLSWVSCCLSSLSLSLSLFRRGEARRAYARAAGRIYSEKAKLNKEEEKKKKKNDDDDDSKEE
jgi:hypothetical protein